MDYALAERAEGAKMRRQISLLCLSAGLVAGCAQIAESPVNPLNWFGSSGATAATVAPTGPLVPPAALAARVDARVAVTVTGVEVARTASGALVRATGTAPGPGYFNAQLARSGTDGGILVLRFVAEAPPAPQAGGTRTIIAATMVTNATLAGLSGVRVEGATGALSARF
jgi:hypothetical protein